MAWMSQENKAKIASELKAALAGSGVKYSLAVRHHSTIVLTVQSGPMDFAADMVVRPGDMNERKTAIMLGTEPYHLGVNPYWYREHYSGASLAFLETVFPILNAGNFDKSDRMTDYFHVGWYVDVNVGKYGKPYQVTGKAVAA